MLQAIFRWIFDRDSLGAQASKGAIGAASYMANWLAGLTAMTLDQANELIRFVGGTASAFCAVVMASGIVIGWVRGRMKRKP